MNAGSTSSTPLSSSLPNPERFRTLSRSWDISRNPTTLAGPLQLDDFGELREEPSVDLGQLVHLIDAPPALERPEHREHAAVGRHHELPLQRHVVLLFARRRRLREEPGALVKLERPDPFENASLNVRPIAIASPTDFIWVVRVRSACGNFSKGSIAAP